MFAAFHHLPENGRVSGLPMAEKTDLSKGYHKNLFWYHDAFCVPPIDGNVCPKHAYAPEGGYLWCHQRVLKHIRLLHAALLRVSAHLNSGNFFLYFAMQAASRVFYEADFFRKYQLHSYYRYF